MANRQKRRRRQPLQEWSRPPLWERIVALFGALLVAGLLAYLFHDAVWGDRTLPDIKVEVEEVRQSGRLHVVSFAATNAGGQTASQVLVRGRLVRNGVVIEEAEATLDYLPSHSVRKGGLFFRQDPGEAELELMPLGYSDP